MAKTPTTAGRYQIIGEIGRGSMGVVYSGYDPVIGRKVAIKTMQTDSLKSSEFADYKARFQREAQSAGVLAHPNIVTVYDFGEDHGILYLTMEFLEGRPLDKVVEELPAMPIETVTRIFEQVCGALNYAHSQKIIHRDIKPANIMVLENGVVKVTDFGIAKIMGGSMTQTGGILGTPNYMSPEQVTGKQLDGRSDIFSLGVILYELTTGQKPFSGENITTVIYKIVNEEPTPPRQLLSSIHPGLASVISKALAKNPSERYQTCQELSDDLKHYESVRAPQPFATVPINAPRGRSADSRAFQAPPPSPSAVRDVSMEPQPPRGASLPARIAEWTAKTSHLFWLLLGILITTAAAGGAYYYFEGLSNHIGNPTRAAGPAGESSSLPAKPAAPALSPSSTTPASAPAGESTRPSGGRAAAAGTATSNAELAPARQGGPYGARVATLTVQTNIPGASVSVDGKSQPEWITPYTFPRLKPGSHQITVAKDGFEGSSRTIEVKPGESRTMQLPLSAETGAFELSTDPPGVEIRIDGQAYGRSPIQAALPAGEHYFAIFQRGNRIYRGTFRLKANGFLRKRVTLGAEAGGGAMAVIRTIPPGASVSLDGRTLEDLTPFRLAVRPGPHVLILSEPGYPQVLRQFRVEAGRSVHVNVMFRH